MEVIAQEMLQHTVIDEDVDDALRALVVLVKDVGVGGFGECETGRERNEYGYVLLSLIYHLGMSAPHIFRKFIDADALDLLKPIIMNCGEHRIHLPATRLMFQVLEVQELSLAELEALDNELIVAILTRIEATHVDSLEEYNYALIELLMGINHQFLIKNHARHIVENRVISSLSTRMYLGKTLGESIIFIFNRAYNEKVQRLILRFLNTLFSAPETAGFFYSNDLRVILDVVLRECQAVHGDDLRLQQAYLIIIPFLVRDPSLKGYKIKDIARLLNQLRNDTSTSTTATTSSSPVSPIFAESPTGTCSGVGVSIRRLADKVLEECTEYL